MKELIVKKEKKTKIGFIMKYIERGKDGNRN